MKIEYFVKDLKWYLNTNKNKTTYDKANELCQSKGYTIPEYIGKFGIKQYKQQIINQ